MFVIRKWNLICHSTFLWILLVANLPMSNLWTTAMIIFLSYRSVNVKDLLLSVQCVAINRFVALSIAKLEIVFTKKYRKPELSNWLFIGDYFVFHFWRYDFKRKFRNKEKQKKQENFKLFEWPEFSQSWLSQLAEAWGYDDSHLPKRTQMKNF